MKCEKRKKIYGGQKMKFQKKKQRDAAENHQTK